MKRGLCLLLCCLALSAKAAVIEEASLRGGARALAMAEAGAAALQGDEATWWNPAGLAGPGDLEISAQRTSWPGDVGQELLQFSSPFTIGRISLWGLYSSSGGLVQRDALGNATGLYDIRTLGAGSAYGMELGDGVRAGLAASVYQQTQLEVSNVELVLQPAVQATLGPIVFGATFNGAGVGRKAWQASAAANWIIEQFQMNLNLGYIDEGAASRFGGGVEVGWQDYIFFRAGYQALSAGSTLAGFQGLCFGLGAVLNQFSFDYAVLPLGELGQAHRVGLAYRWQRQKKEALPPALPVSKPQARATEVLPPPPPLATATPLPAQPTPAATETPSPTAPPTLAPSPQPTQAHDLKREFVVPEP